MREVKLSKSDLHFPFRDRKIMYFYNHEAVPKDIKEKCEIASYCIVGTLSLKIQKLWTLMSLAVAGMQ